VALCVRVYVCVRVCVCFMLTVLLYLCICSMCARLLRGLSQAQREKLLKERAEDEEDQEVRLNLAGIDDEAARGIAQCLRQNTVLRNLR
jgi:hypothetical protein